MLARTAGRRSTHCLHRHIPIIKEGLPAVSAVQSEEELWKREEQVLIEKVEDHRGNPLIGPSAMDQDQAPEEPEFTKRKVTGLHRSEPFLAVDPDSNVRFLDHVNIIRTVANS